MAISSIPASPTIQSRQTEGHAHDFRIDAMNSRSPIARPHLVGFHSRASRCASSIWAGVIKEIAHELGISERSVKTRRAEVMAKLGAGSVAELVRQAEQLRLLSEGDGPP